MNQIKHCNKIYWFALDIYKIQFNFLVDTKAKTLIYAKMFNLQDKVIAAVRVNIVENNQLYVDIKDHKSYHNYRHQSNYILIGRCIDRALRSNNIGGFFKVLILQSGSLWENQYLCHLAVFFAGYKWCRLSCYCDENILLSRSRNGILALEVSQQPSWKLKTKISQIYKKAKTFLTFLQKSFGKLSKQEIKITTINTDMKIEELLNTISDRQAISGWLTHHKKRLDNRALDQIRTINITPLENNRLDFARGSTYISSTVYAENKKGYYNTNYYFPNGSARRSIGHTNLVYKTIKPHLNDTVSINSINEVIFSDGSSSMGSVCAESLILHRLGLLTGPIVGLSFGLFRNSITKDFIVFCDLTAQEDQYSETDVKITANKNGFLTVQMDTKSPISPTELSQILQLAKIKLQELKNHIEPYCNKNILTNLLPDEYIGSFIGRNKNHLTLVHDLLNTSNITVYGNSVVAIDLTIKQKNKYKKILSFFYPKSGSKVIFQIKNLDPLASILGKFTNSGSYSKFQINDFVSGIIETWSNKLKVIKIISTIS